MTPVTDETLRHWQQLDRRRELREVQQICLDNLQAMRRRLRMQITVDHATQIYHLARQTHAYAKQNRRGPTLTREAWRIVVEARNVVKTLKEQHP